MRLQTKKSIQNSLICIQLIFTKHEGSGRLPRGAGIKRDRCGLFLALSVIDRYTERVSGMASRVLWTQGMAILPDADSLNRQHLFPVAHSRAGEALDCVPRDELARHMYHCAVGILCGLDESMTPRAI